MTKLTTAAAPASGPAAPSRDTPPVDLKRYIVDVHDFPRTGILFRDITPLLCTRFAATLDAL